MYFKNLFAFKINGFEQKVNCVTPVGKFIPFLVKQIGPVWTLRLAVPFLEIYTIIPLYPYLTL